MASRQVEQGRAKARAAGRALATAPASAATTARQATLNPLSRDHHPKTKRIVTLDIESKDGDSQRAGFTRPFLTGLFDGERLSQWRNAPEVRRLPWQERHLARGGCIDAMMRACLSDEYVGARFYAHNGGAFDFLFCVAWLASEKTYKFSITPQGPNILALRIELSRKARKVARRKRKGIKRARKRAAPKASTRRGAHWTFVDSLRLLPMSLKEASKVFGGTVVKGQMALGAPERDPRWEAYHAQDLRSLYASLTAVQRMLEELGGEMTLTAPAAALKLFQRKYLGKRVERSLHEPGCMKKDECKACAHAFVRRAYKGGRVEPYFVGKTRRGVRLYYYDVNSSYPAAMLHGMPSGPLLVHQGPNLPRPLEWYLEKERSGEWVGFVDCDVEVPEGTDPPPLPYHEPHTGKLIFPVGQFSGTWDLCELALLSEVGGRVLHVRKLYLYPASPLFRTMIEALYPLRTGGDAGLGKLVKLLLNALYGKFGQRPEREEVLYLPPNRARVVPEGATPAGGDPFRTDVWYVTVEKDAPHIMPQIAAHVTSLARVRLWMGMRQAQERGGSLYYCDTDSIVCDVKLPSSKTLGKLKREYECPNLRGEFVRPKVYQVWCACRGKARARCPFYLETCKKKGIRAKRLRGYKIVCKGVPSRSLSPEVFAKFVVGRRVEFERLAKLKTMAKEGMRSPWKVRTHKRMATQYDKRIVRADGTTTPIVLSLPARAEVA